MLLVPNNTLAKAVQAAIPSFIARGPSNIQQVMASPPTVAQSTTNPLPNQRWATYDNSQSPTGVGSIDLSFVSVTKCGNPVVNNALSNQVVSFQNVSSVGAAGNYQGSNSVQYSVMFTSVNAAPVLVLAVYGRGGDVFIKINDQYTSLTPVSVPVNGVLNYISITWAAPVTNVRVDFISGNITNNIPLSGFFTLTGDTLYPAPIRGGRRIIVMGDSYTSATGAGGTALGYLQTASDYLGVDDMWGVGVGGSGILAPGTSVPYLARMKTDVYPFNPDVLVIQGFFNDGSSTYAALSAGLIALLQDALSNLPNAQIIIFGPCVQGGSGAWPGTSSTTGFNAQRSLIQNALTQLNNPNLRWIDPSTGPAPIVPHTTVLTSSPAAYVTTFNTQGNFMCEAPPTSSLTVAAASASHDRQYGTALPRGQRPYHRTALPRSATASSEALAMWVHLRRHWQCGHLYCGLRPSTPQRLTYLCYGTSWGMA